MENIGIILICLSALSSFICARNLAIAGFRAYSRQKILLNACSTGQASLFLKLQTICHRFAKKISNYALKLTFFRETATNLATFLVVKGERATPEAVSSVLVVGVFLIFIMSTLLTFSFVFGICLSLLALVLTSTICSNRLEAHAHQIRAMVPDALRAMGDCAKSGLSLMQTLEQTSKECGGSLGRVFLSAANRMKMGLSTPQSLSLLSEIKEVPELKFVSVALQVQHISGGSITPVLEEARVAVLSEIDLLRTLRIQTVQAKMSAAIVTVMPFLLLALFSFMSPDFLHPFLSSPIGVVMLVVALSMQGLGVWCVRKILKNE